MTGRLETLAERRRAAVEEADRAHRALLDAVVEELEADRDVNVRALAVTAGIARATVYNELARRQQTRDTLSSNGHPPAAPADADNGAATPPRPLSDPMRVALIMVGHGSNPITEGVPRARASVEALRRRGFIKANDLDLTRAGELELARVEAKR